MALSDRLAARLIHTVCGKELMPFDDHRWMDGLGMIGTRANYDTVQQYDLLVLVGTDYPYAEYLPADGNVIPIDHRSEVLGRRTPTALGFLGSVRPSLKAILERVPEKQDTDFFDKVAHGRLRWNEMLDKQADVAQSKDHIHPQAVARLASDLADNDAVFVLDTGLNTLWSAN